MYIRKTQELEEEKFDPLNVLPQEILDIIFGYLGVKDLLNLSLSSLNWYNTIENSECIKKRTKLVIKCESLDANMVGILLSSAREYQNIRIEHPSDSEISTNSKKDINTVLKKFSSAIKSLETPTDIPRVCDMPKLRRLVFDSADCYPTYGRIIQYYETGLFKKLELIEELYILQYKWTDKFLKHFKDTLPNMMNLKILRVSKNIFKDAEYSFQLRKFECYGFTKDEDMINLIKFLKSQSASLEILITRLSRLDIDEALSTILAMPKLTTLTLGIAHNANVSGRLPINNTIKSFTKTKLGFRDNSAMPMLAFLENLQVLTVEKLTTSVVNAISTCPSIRQVQYKFLPYGVPEDYMTTVRQQYPNIEFIIKSNYDQDYGTLCSRWYFRCFFFFLYFLGFVLFLVFLVFSL